MSDENENEVVKAGEEIEKLAQDSKDQQEREEVAKILAREKAENEKLLGDNLKMKDMFDRIQKLEQENKDLRALTLKQKNLGRATNFTQAEPGDKDTLKKLYPDLAVMGYFS